MSVLISKPKGSCEKVSNSFGFVVFFLQQGQQ
jgi:hypothetical protein